MNDNNSCPECPPPGLPGWLATFSDLMTLLLTFFVLLLSFAKTESAKYESALGSIRDAFGGNIIKKGDVFIKGKSPSDAPTMMESEQLIRPFPIEFFSTEGMLDKYEVNRFSDESLLNIRKDLKEYSLTEDVFIYEMPEGIKVIFKDKIYFKKGSTEIQSIADTVYKNLIRLISNKKWIIFVQGHSSPGEVSLSGKNDALVLSSERAISITRSLIAKGISPEKITPVFYGDTKPSALLKSHAKWNRRVEFMIRQIDLQTPGYQVPSHL